MLYWNSKSNRNRNRKVKSSAGQLIIEIWIPYLESVACKVFPVCTAYVGTKKINSKLIHIIFWIKGCKFKFQQIIWLIDNRLWNKKLLFATKSLKNHINYPLFMDRIPICLLTLVNKKDSAKTKLKRQKHF